MSLERKKRQKSMAKMLQFYESGLLRCAVFLLHNQMRKTVALPPIIFRQLLAQTNVSSNRSTKRDRKHAMEGDKNCAGYMFLKEKIFIYSCHGKER